MKKPRSVFLFRYADYIDVMLLVAGSIFAFIHGAAMPILGIVFGKMTDAFVIKTKQGQNDCNPSPSEVNGTVTNDSWSTTSSSVTQNSNCIPSDEFSAMMTSFALEYVYIGIGVFTMSIMQVLCWEISCERQVFHIRQKFFYQVLRQEISWYDDQQTGDLTTKLQDDVERVKEGIGHKFSMVMQYLATFLAGFVVGFSKSWKLTLIIMALTPVLAGTSAFTGRVMASSSAREQEKYGLAGAIANEVIACIRTVAAFGGQPREIRRYEKALEDGSKTAKGKYQVIGIGCAIVFLVMYGTYALAFWYGAKLYIDHQLSVGDLFTVFFSVLMGAFSLGNAVPYVSSIGVAQGAARTIFSVIDSVPSIDPYSPRGLQLESVQGSIQFRQVSFSYPSRKNIKILRNFSLEAEPGQTVALVGPSGSGKSTVVSLLLRYYDPNRGDVLIDGRNVRDLNVSSLRHHIGVVSQEPILFGCSIAENIRYGRQDVTFEEMVQASRMANAHSFITALPMGYDTLVGERGAQLSGGQKQRIAIARALVRNPRILLLDEATSALDAQSEGIVQAALNKARQGRTTIVIAHRLSTIKDADVICVVKAGEIVEQGTHSELMSLEGLYFELVQAQMGTVLQAEEIHENVDRMEDNNRKMSKMSGRRKSSRRMSSLRRSSTLIRRSMSITSISDRDTQRIAEEFEDEEVEEPSVWKIIKMNAPEWPLLTFGTLGAAVSGASMPVFAFFYSEIFKTFTRTGADLQTAAVFWSCMFVVLAIATGVSMYARIVGLALSGEKLTMRLRVLGFTNILRQSVGWFDDEENAGGRITTRLARDAPIVKQAAGHRVGLLMSAIVTLAAALGIAFAYSWKLALVIVAGFPLLVASGFIELRMKRGGQAIDDELMEEAGRIASECLANVRTVQALVQEKTFYKNYMSNLQPAFKEAQKQAYVYGVVFAFSEGIMLFLYAAAYKYGGYLVDIHDTDPVSVYRVFFAISFCAVAVGQTMGFLPDYMKAKMAAGLMFKLMEMDPEIDNLSTEGEKPIIRGKVTFQDVHFRYPMRPNIRILRGLSFTLEPGRSFALVGPSGCGKSTAIALLERFYDPKRGIVMVDDYDIRRMSLPYLRSQIGLVTQEPVLFDCSIRDNIAYGEYDDVVDEDITKAAKVANIHDFICGLPKGYDTMVGERGTQLSGGQKQRIAIARALIRDPKILLLDEATSALDTENEKIVQEALDQAMKGRTTIIIAHRLTTIRNADCIAVVEKGQITEMGTHQELVNKRGMYYRLTKRQQLTH